MSFYAVCAGLYDGLIPLLGFILSDWELSNGKAKKVEAHVAVAFLLCFKGVGKPCFGLLEFEPHAFEPFLDSLFASLYAFPCVMEDDKVVGIPDTIGPMGELLAVYRMCGWATGVFHDVFEAVQRNVCKEG